MMISRTLLRWVALGGLLLADGCAQLRAANASPPPMEGQLQATLAQADAEAVALRFGVADRLLADYAESHANTPEAVETQFWRAVYRLNPLNQNAPLRDAVAMLDSYLNGPVSGVHRGAAMGLRRLALASDRSTAAAPATAGMPTPGPATRDEEMQRLKDELAKANAELDRIRKRLSQPNP
jgi:hypothetical protein